MGSFQAREAASRSIEIGHVFLVAAVPLAGANCQRETIVTQLARLRQWDFLEKCGKIRPHMGQQAELGNCHCHTPAAFRAFMARCALFHSTIASTCVHV